MEPCRAAFPRRPPSTDIVNNSVDHDIDHAASGRPFTPFCGKMSVKAIRPKSLPVTVDVISWPRLRIDTTTPQAPSDWQTGKCQSEIGRSASGLVVTARPAGPETHVVARLDGHAPIFHRPVGGLGNKTELDAESLNAKWFDFDSLIRNLTKRR
jgi:hypothetical protein